MTLRLKPSNNASDNIVVVVTAKLSRVLGRMPITLPLLMLRNHFDALCLAFRIQLFADIYVVANHMLSLRLDHIEVEDRLNQCDVMAGRRMHAGDEWQTVAVCDFPVFHALTAFHRPDVVTSTFRSGKDRVDEGFPHVDRPLLVKHFGQLRQCNAQHYSLAALLKATMHRSSFG